jgi:hypothetical protein
MTGSGGGTASGGSGGNLGGSGAGGAQGPTDGPPHDGVVYPTVEGTNCADLAKVWCARAQECEPVSQRYMIAGTDCPTRLTGWCQNYLAAPADTNWAPAAFKACVTGLLEISCPDWRTSNEYLKAQACLISGKRKVGQGCSSWSQCESVRCEHFGACGLCGNRANTEGTCDSDVDCNYGLICSRQGTCKRPAVAGERCGPAIPCRGDLFCDANTNTCKPKGAVGAPCTAHRECELENELLCNDATGKCGRGVASPTWSTENPDGTVSYCANNGTPVGMAGACAQRVADGEVGCVYDDEDGRQCIFPALCRKAPRMDTGSCQLPVPVDCAAVRPDPPMGGYPAGQDPWCPNPDFPVFCPGRADVGPNCWGARAVCTTTVNCDGEANACVAADFSYDCQLKKCSVACAPPAAGASACDQCTVQKCCGTKTMCDADPMCATKAGPNWIALRTCQTMFCDVCR